MEETKNSTSSFSDFVASNSEEFSKLNDSIMSRQFKAVGAIYIDHQCLKDTRLGLLIHLSDQNRMQYLISRINKYNLRPNRRFLFAYPEFPYTEEQLTKMYTDPKMTDALFNRAPDTMLMLELWSVIKSIRAKNSQASGPDHMKVTINMWPLAHTPLLDKYQELMQLYLDPHQTSIKVELVYTDPTSLPLLFWLQHRICFLDDIARMSQTETPFVVGLTKDQALSEHNIFAAFQCDDDALSVWKEDGEDFSDLDKLTRRFELSAAVFGLLCEFSFLPFPIPAPGTRKRPDITT